VRLLLTAALIPAAGIPTGVALGLSDAAILGSLFAIALVAAVVPPIWELWRRKRDRKSV
jgi:hypothetical protein